MIGIARNKKKWALLGMTAMLAVVAAACGSDDAPATGPGGGDRTVVPTPPPSSDITKSGVDAVVGALAGAGATVVVGDAEADGLFRHPLTQLSVNGERVDVYVYADAEAAKEATRVVSDDGTTFTFSGEGEPAATSILFIAPPHFFLFENAIIAYIGRDEGVVTALRDALGAEFAGPGAEPVVLPDSPDGLEPGACGPTRQPFGGGTRSAGPC